MLIDSIDGEIRFAADVPPAERAALHAAFHGVSADLASEKLGIARVQPLLGAARDAVSDGTVSRAETSALLQKAREVRREEGAGAIPAHP